MSMRNIDLTSVIQRSVCFYEMSIIVYIVYIILHTVDIKDHLKLFNDTQRFELNIRRNPLRPLRMLAELRLTDPLLDDPTWIH